MRRSDPLARIAIHTVSALALASAGPRTAGAQRPAAAVSARSSTPRALAYTKFTLANGLTAILNEDHDAPIVAVDVYYRIGSRDDVPGRAGAAHFCEHLMSEGTPNLNQPQSDFYRTIGGTSPRAATTTEDITHFYVIVPSAQLETVIWAEADRLANPMSLADAQRVASVREVLTRERSQMVQNVPAGAARELVLQKMYPSGHPYFMSGASPMADLPKLGAPELRDACLPFYVPNNAVLALSGNFTTATTRRWIEKYFGPIPRGASPKRRNVPAAELSEEKRLVLEDARITVPQIRIGWLGASYADPDRIPLLALASTLSLARFASDGHLISIGVEPPTALGRLSKLLVDDRRLATRVIVDNYDLEKSGLFEVAVFPRPGASLTTIESLVDSVVAGFASAPATHDELARFNSYNSVYLATSLQPRFMRADTLAHDEIFAGDPSAYARQAVAAQALTPSDIDRVIRKFLGSKRVVMSIVPAGKLELVSKPNVPFTNVTP